MLQEKAHEHSLYIYLSKLKDEYKSTEGVTSQVTWLILFLEPFLMAAVFSCSKIFVFLSVYLASFSSHFIRY